MSYLNQYDQIPPDQPGLRVATVTRWIRTEWRAFFSELRTLRPVFRIPGITLLTGYDDVVSVLSRPKEFSVRLYSSKMEAVVGPFMLGTDETTINWRDKAMMQLSLPFSDFDSIRRLVAELTKGIITRHTGPVINVVQSISRDVPIKLCGEYFGFPGPDIDTMKRWSKTTQTDFFKNIGNDPAISEAAIKSGTEMKAYLARLLADYRTNNSQRPDSVIARLLSIKTPPEIGFSEERLIANIAGLLIGSVETTSQAIVQALDQILRRPSVVAKAREAANAGNEQIFNSIIWEALRFDPINPLLFRYVEHDTELVSSRNRERVSLSKGSIVFACTASAMQDEQSIPNADAFQANRPESTYLHFGFGHHKCLGTFVGTIMVTEVIRQLLLLPNIARLPENGSRIDFQDGPFPEKYEIAV